MEQIVSYELGKLASNFVNLTCDKALNLWVGREKYSLITPRLRSCNSGCHLTAMNNREDSQVRVGEGRSR